MNHSTGAPPQDIFEQDLVFTPQMVQLAPAELELGHISGNFMLYRKAAKGGKEGKVSVFNLAQQRPTGQFDAEGLAISRLTAGNTGNIGDLTPDGKLFACIKAKAVAGHALRVIDTQSNSRTKSCSFDVGGSPSTAFASGVRSHTLLIADSQKGKLSIWDLASMEKQPPASLCGLSSPYPEGTSRKVSQVAYYLGGREGEGWVVVTESVQWPLLKEVFADVGFKAGTVRFVQTNVQSGQGSDWMDVWAHAGCVVNVPDRGGWLPLLCYANRMTPRDHMTLHFRDAATPTFIRQGESNVFPTPQVAFQVQIPTYDGSEVPLYVHPVAQQRDSVVVVVTAAGMLHAFSALSGQLLGTSRFQHLPPRGTPEISCHSVGPDLYMKVGPIVGRIRVGEVEPQDVESDILDSYME